MNAAFEREKSASGGESDLEDIRRSGELIVATISGPETYYDYHGAGLGLQYALADDFARSEGLKVRVELANDTTELLAMVKRGDADVAALPVGEERIKEAGLQPAGVNDAKLHTSWAVRPHAEELAEALRAWFTSTTLAEVHAKGRPLACVCALRAPRASVFSLPPALRPA